MSQRAPIVLLVVAVAASAALLFSFVSNLIFVGDSWEFLAGRPDWSVSTFLEPFNEHAVLVTALIFKVLLTLFGMDSALPFYAVSISLFLLCAVLMFAFMRRRVGDWAALAGAVLLLFMGAAYEDLLWEFQMSFFGSIAAGLGAFLALDREDRTGDRLATALLVLSMSFSSLGVPFVIATAVRIGLGPPPRWRRAYVPLIPLALYGIWWVASGHSAGNGIGLGDIPDLPRYTFEAAAAGIASLLGRQPIEGNGAPPVLAQVLTLLLGAILVYWIARRRQVPPGLIVGLVLALSFWGLLALDRGPIRFSSRFQYPSGVFLLIIATEALRGQRLPRLANFVLVAITAGAMAGGVALLEQGYSARWKSNSDTTRANLAAVEIAGAKARSDFEIRFPPSLYIPVESYRDARRAHGTPAYSEAELLSAEDTERRRADRTLVTALDLSLLAPASAGRLVRCRAARPRPGSEAKLSLGAQGKFQLANLSDREVSVEAGRFSPDIPVNLGVLPPRASASLHLPADESDRPWQLAVADGPIRVCALG